MYPIYKNLSKFECSRCERIVEGDNYSMLWNDKPYCAKCALKMKQSGEVIDRELKQEVFVKKVCKTCGKLINDRPESATQCLECIKQGKGL